MTNKEEQYNKALEAKENLLARLTEIKLFPNATQHLNRPTKREALEAAIIAHKAQGLEQSDFDLYIAELVVESHLNSDEAVAYLLNYYSNHNK